ncbi:hypothetical protein WSM22_04890 [Cytophagales bacterium WSM2-2]|nr:hypothetical protein WSM22_04890 [Cytophagales bacterium WSM2-2]
MTVKTNLKPLIISVAFSLFAFTKITAQNNSTMLQKFISRPGTEILHDLFYLKQRERSGEEITQPLITVMPSNKLPISGFLIDFKDDKDQRGIVLERAGSTDVVFLELGWITGVAIHEADRIALYLVDLTPADIKATATKLEVKGKMKKESDRLSQAISSISLTMTEEDLPSNAQQLYLANQFVTDIAMSLIEIAKTDLGKESIKSGIKSISIKKGASFDIKLANGTLTIESDFIHSYTTTSARNKLIEKIYNLL